MRNFTLLITLLICIFLIATGCTPPAADDAQDDGQGDSTAQTDNGTPTGETNQTGDMDMTDTTSETPMDMPDADASMVLPETWPADIPIIEGMTIVNVLDLTSPVAVMINVTTKGNLTMEEIAEFYKDLPEWEIDDRMPEEVTNTKWFVKLKKGTDDLGVNIELKRGITELYLQYVSR